MKKIWDYWEELAKKYLEKHWYKIIEQNYKYSRVWEIDIIAKLDDIYIFVEVKFRKNNNYWWWEWAITDKKKEKIYLSIMNYITENNIDEENIKFDIIVINNEDKKLIHYKNQALN